MDLILTLTRKIFKISTNSDETLIFSFGRQKYQDNVLILMSYTTFQILCQVLFQNLVSLVQRS